MTRSLPSAKVTWPTLGQATTEQTVIGNALPELGVEEFRGIPYGHVPARWQHSQLRTELPAAVFDAKSNGPRCPQPQGPNNSDSFQAYLPFPKDVGESEFDCLNLTIVRPSSQALKQMDKSEISSPIPVLVWIHGGAYAFGSSSDPMWNPSRLVARSISIGMPMLVVSINYRLNIFGFGASSGIISRLDPTGPQGCNFGLGDQHIALEWVQRNIGYFGGDPNMVTVAGQSAGGSSAHAHVLEAQSGRRNPLLRRGIIQSGAVGTLGPILFAKASDNVARLCASLGLVGSSSEQVAACAAVSPDVLLQHVEQLQYFAFPLVNDGVTVFPSDVAGAWDVQLARSPVDGVADVSPLGSGIDVMLGDTDVEASLWYDQVNNMQSYEDVLGILQRHIPSSGLEEILNAYQLTSNTPIDVLRPRIQQLMTDVDFGYPVHQAHRHLRAKLGSKNSQGLPVSTKRYRIRYGNPWSGPQQGIAHHCVELIYLFDAFCKDMEALDEGSEKSGAASHQDLVLAMQTMWISFVNGTDNPKVGPDEAIVFEHDRSLSVQSMPTSEEWTEREQRFSILARWLESAGNAVHEIASLSEV